MTYNSTVLADTPKHYVTFDQAGATNTDSGSQAATITVTGSPTKTAGIGATTGLTYNGTSDYVTISSNQYDFGASSTFTFECWFKSTATTGQPTFIRRDGNGAAYLLRLNAGKVEFYCNQSGIVTTASYADGKWHHVVGVKNGTATTLYVDGTSVGTGTGNTVAQTAGAQPIYLGESTTAASEMMVGTLDEVAIYSTALTSTRISAHYAAGANSTQTPPAMTMSMSAPAVTYANVILPPAMTLSLSTATPDIREHKYYAATASEDGFGSGTDSTTLQINPSSSGSVQANIQFTDLPSAPAGQKLRAIFSIDNTNSYFAGNANTYNVYRITSPWSVATGTSFTQPTYDTTSMGSFTIAYGAASGFYSIDISNAANAWAGGAPNYGVAIVTTSGTGGCGQHFAGYGDTTNHPKLDVSNVPLPPDVTVTVPAATLSLSAPAPVVGVSQFVQVPAMTLALDMVLPSVSETGNITLAAPAMGMSLDFPGGTPALPDYLAQPNAMTIGVDTSTPNVFIAYPAIASAPAMALSLDTAAPTINLTTNVLKIAPVMTMSVNMVGIFDEAHDRYLAKLVGTLGAEDIWYKLNEAAGSTAVDSSTDPLYTSGWAQWLQNGTYNGTFAAINDGPQLRKGVRFDGATSFLKVGPYTARDPEPDITREIAVTVEFSIRTTQTDGVVFIGTGYQGSTTVASGPVITGNELRLEAGNLVLVNKAGQKVKVRKFISDGNWHHIVMAIPQALAGGGAVLDPSQPAYVMVDGDHALVRYNTFLGDTQSYGGFWLPFTVMARATTLTGNFAPNGFLAADLSNFVVRVNKYVSRDVAQTIYYEWSDANVISPPPMTVSLSTPAPKVKGSVKKMLALYGLPFVIGHGAPAVGQSGQQLYEYLDVLSGMIIENLGGSVNLQQRLGGITYWPAPKTFMLNDYFVVPVSIFGNLNDNDSYAQSVDGTLNPDSPVTVNGMFVDDETGHPRFINLQNDLSANVTEEYDVITVVNYPWERPFDSAVGEYNYITPFHGLGNMDNEQWEQARDGFRDSIMEAVYDGCNLWIGDYYAAMHLGFIQGYDTHDFGRWDAVSTPQTEATYSGTVAKVPLNNKLGTVGAENDVVGATLPFTYNMEAQVIDNQHLIAENKSHLVGSGQGDYFSYPQSIFYRRITALVPDLTDLPGNDYGPWVEGYNVDEWMPNGNFLAYDVLRRPNGFQLGDQTSMRLLWMGSKFFSEVTGHTSLSEPRSRVAVTSARPDGICGTVVSREQEVIYGPFGGIYENPYKDNALTIAAERGTIVRGRPIGGRAFIELMCTEAMPGYIGEDVNKKRWHGSDTVNGVVPSTWDYDSRRELELKNALSIQALHMSDKQGGFTVETKTTYFFVYSSEVEQFNLYLPMTYRGLNWLSKAPEIPLGDARVYASAVELTLTTPNATLDKTSSPASQIIGPMRLNLAVRQPANYADGNIEVDVFGAMEMALELRGLGRLVQVPPMSLSVITPNPDLKVEADTVTVYLDEGRNFTLFLKEDN